MNSLALTLTTDTWRKGAALIVPLILIASMYWCYQTFNKQYGYTLGYLLGYGVYWLFWCIIIPLILVGGVKPLIGLFQPFPAFTDLSWKTHLLLWLPVVFPLFFIFIPRIGKTNINILIVPILLGLSLV